MPGDVTTPVFDVAIVGGGASGTLLALHLLGQGKGRLRIALIERGREFARGIAYGAQAGEHLLNTRAADMSVWPDRPEHFVQWLAGRGEPDREGFVPRRVFGLYLAELLDAAMAQGEGALTLIKGDVVDLRETDGGMAVEITGSEPVIARRVVLATGHRRHSEDEGAFHGDPWSSSALDGLAPNATVLLLGTGLTMIDVAVSLITRGQRGRIVALSRRGLVPRMHPAVPPKAAHHDLPERLRLGELSGSLAEFRRMVRAGQPWSEVMHTLRPHNASLWRGLSLAQQRRFLRHLRPWWDVHRHRAAPEPGRMVEAARRSGQLEIVRGRIVELKSGEGAVELCFARRGARAAETLTFDRAIDCRGPRNDIPSDRGLLSRLAAAGLVRPDALGLGLDIDDAGHVLNAAGEASPSLLAFGPQTRGRHWEITAVPDIRKAALAMATRLAAD